MSAAVTIRAATVEDLPALEAVMDLSIAQLQNAFLDAEQVEASRSVMGIDTQLVKDGSYLLALCDGEIASCGGWSFRKTLYGGDHTQDQRDPERLDPRVDAARVRAMYTHPRFARRGMGRLILSACETQALKAGFMRCELMATLAGKPLYAACGYHVIEAVSVSVGPVSVPLVRMGKTLSN